MLGWGYPFRMKTIKQKKNLVIAVVLLSCTLGVLKNVYSIEEREKIGIDASNLLNTTSRPSTLPEPYASIQAVFGGPGGVLNILPFLHDVGGVEALVIKFATLKFNNFCSNLNNTAGCAQRLFAALNLTSVTKCTIPTARSGAGEFSCMDLRTKRKFTVPLFQAFSVAYLFLNPHITKTRSTSVLVSLFIGLNQFDFPVPVILASNSSNPHKECCVCSCTDAPIAGACHFDKGVTNPATCSNTNKNLDSCSACGSQPRDVTCAIVSSSVCD